MSNAQLALEVALLLLLGATLFNAVRLERALGVLKRDRAVLEELVAGFNDSTRQAEAGVERLRGAADGAGRQIARQIEQAQRLRDDLAFLSERGEKLDVLINNAAINRSPAKEVWNVNVRGPLRLTRALEPLLTEGARVVMVSSGMGRSSAQDPKLMERLRKIHTLDDFEALSDDAPGDYGASKAALNRMSELFAEAFKARHVLVNAISPGCVRTDLGGAGAPRTL